MSSFSYEVLKMTKYVVPVSILDDFLQQGEGIYQCKLCNLLLHLYSENGWCLSPDFKESKYDS